MVSKAVLTKQTFL